MDVRRTAGQWARPIYGLLSRPAVQPSDRSSPQPGREPCQRRRGRAGQNTSDVGFDQAACGGCRAVHHRFSRPGCQRAIGSIAIPKLDRYIVPPAGSLGTVRGLANMHEDGGRPEQTRISVLSVQRGPLGTGDQRHCRHCPNGGRAGQPVDRNKDISDFRRRRRRGLPCGRVR